MKRRQIAAWGLLLMLALLAGVFLLGVSTSLLMIASDFTSQADQTEGAGAIYGLMCLLLWGSLLGAVVFFLLQLYSAVHLQRRIPLRWLSLTLALAGLLLLAYSLWQPFAVIYSTHVTTGYASLTALLGLWSFAENQSPRRPE